MGNRKLLWLSLLLALSLPLYLGGCGGSSSEAPGEPGGPGISTVDVSSGNGLVNHADGAGTFAVYSYPGGGIHAFTGGTADPSFTVNVPQATPTFGTEALVVTDNVMVIAATTALDTEPDNVVKFYLGPRTFEGNVFNTLWHRQADNVSFKRVTGIQVPANRVLELRLNTDEFSSALPGLVSTAGVSLANDLEVAGTIRTAAFDCAVTQISADGNSRGALFIDASGIFIRSTGKVTTAGASTTNAAAGNGGVIRLFADFGHKNGGLFLNEGTIDGSGGNADNNAGGNGGSFAGSTSNSNLWGDGYVINKGTVSFAGGNGTISGGNGGSVYIQSNQYAYNTAPVTVKGGNATAGGGGSAGFISLETSMFNVYNSGALTASGGNGTASGGSGNWVNVGNGLNGPGAGDTLNKGAINVSGGNGTATAGGHGGSAGSADLWADGGKMASAADINANGGATADNTSGFHGGGPGQIFIGSYDGWFDSGPRGSGEVSVSGNLLAKGGNGYYGDNGGYVEIGNFGSLTAGSKGGVTLFGYSAFLANGGSSAGTGYSGHGGTIIFDSRAGFATNIGPFGGQAPIAPPGPIVNRPLISVNAGAADKGSGSSAGEVVFDAADTSALPSGPAAGLLPNPMVTNSGAVSMNGGRGGTSGGSAGLFLIFAGSDITASGAVTANGGINATDNGFSSGSGGAFIVSSTNGNATVSGGIALNGGNSQQFASGGGELSVESKTSSLSGTVAANGGNATFSDGVTHAGSGGDVIVTSKLPAVSAVSGPVSVVKGTGGKLTVSNGSIVIDGVDRVSAGGLFP